MHSFFACLDLKPHLRQFFAPWHKRAAKIERREGDKRSARATKAQVPFLFKAAEKNRQTEKSHTRRP